MRITFLLRSLSRKFSATGMVLLRHAYELQKKDYSVSVIVPADRGDSFKKESFFKKMNLSYKFRKFYNLLQRSKVHLDCPWIEVNDFNLPVVEVPDLSEKYIPDGDIIIAGSAWMLDALISYDKSKGERFYLIQAYELNSKANLKRYYLPVRKIAVSSYLKSQIEEVTALQNINVVNNGVDLELFNSEGRKRNVPPERIGMVYYYKSPFEIKAVSDGVKAFEIIKKKYPGLKLVMFGTKKDKGVPEYAEFHQSPSRKKIAEIYRSCDIFLSPSRQEACQLPPMEAMACGCALVATKVGGVSDYTIQGETVLASPAGYPERLAQNMLNLVESPVLFENVAKAGNEYIKNFSWKKMSGELEKVIK